MASTHIQMNRANLLKFHQVVNQQVDRIVFKNYIYHVNKAKNPYYELFCAKIVSILNNMNVNKCKMQ